MKKLESRLTIKRASTSPYFCANFNQLETETLNPYVDMQPSESPAPSDILITNTHTNFDLLSADQIESLKLVIHPNSGYDNIPVDFVKSIKAPIIVGNIIRAEAVAQYILSALFNQLSPIPHHEKWSKERKWPQRLLSTLKVTVIGFGHIGKLLQTTLAPLVKELSVYDPFEKLPQLNHQRSDVVILAASLNNKSRHIIDKNFLNAIKENALIINAARGGLIKTSDLINYLSANVDAFAILDVFEKEPNDFANFKHLKNIKLTSHIAGVHTNIDERTVNFEVEVVKNFLEFTDFDFKNKYQKMILQNKLRSDIGLI